MAAPVSNSNTAALAAAGTALVTAVAAYNGVPQRTTTVATDALQEGVRSVVNETSFAAKGGTLGLIVGAPLGPVGSGMCGGVGYVFGLVVDAATGALD